MTVQLLPCGHVPCPCPECESFDNLTRTGPDARVVIYMFDSSRGTLQSGALIYTPSGGGSPVVQGMTVVAAGSKLCLGREASRAGPLLYTSAVPKGATITRLSYTYDRGPPQGPITFDKAVGACAGWQTDILQKEGELACDAVPVVVASGASCAPCGEATGTSTSFGGGSGGTRVLTQGVTCSGFGSNSCVSPIANASSVWSNFTLRPATWTPAAATRPCNWTSLAFSVTLTSALTYSGPGTPQGGIVTCACTYTKVAGSNIITVTSAANNAIGLGCVGGYDQLVRTNYTTQVHTWGSFDIPCTLYKLRQRHAAVKSDICSGGGRYVPAVNQIYADLMPR